MPEIIDHGRTGLLVADVDGAVDAIRAAADLDRNTVRRATIERFDVSVMIDEYVTVYRSVLGANPETDLPDLRQR